MKKLLVFIFLATSFFLYACGAGDQQPVEDQSTNSSPSGSSESNPAYDPERGEGKFKDVVIPAKLDAAMAVNGEKVYGVKCSSCHKLSAEKMVGPGWKGVIQKHKPEWIMNFITNTDAMITKDPKALAMLELCMIRMPNQNLSDADARAVYEFMRKNDGVK